MITEVEKRQLPPHEPWRDQGQQPLILRVKKRIGRDEGADGRAQIAAAHLNSGINVVFYVARLGFGSDTLSSC